LTALRTLRTMSGMAASDEDLPATKGEVWKIGSLLEQVAGHVRTIADGHGALDAKLTAVADDVADVKSELEMHGLRLKRIEHHLGLNGAPVRAGRAPARKPPAKRPKR
jgi:hypothetical protein